MTAVWLKLSHRQLAPHAWLQQMVQIQLGEGPLDFTSMTTKQYTQYLPSNLHNIYSYELEDIMGNNVKPIRKAALNCYRDKQTVLQSTDSMIRMVLVNFLGGGG